MAYKKRRRKHYKKRSYKKRSDDALTSVLGFLIVLFVVAAGVQSLDFTNLFDPVRMAFGTALPVVFLVAGIVAVLFASGVAWKLWQFITHLHGREQHRRTVNRQYEIATTYRSFAHLDWRQFEHFVGEVFRRQGYRVTVTQGSHDKGIDAKLYKDGKVYLVQAKFQKPGNNVGGPKTREFGGTILGYDGGFLVTTSDFTPDAYEYARDIDRLTLINGVQLRDLIDSL